MKKSTHSCPQKHQGRGRAPSSTDYDGPFPQPRVHRHSRLPPSSASPAPAQPDITNLILLSAFGFRCPDQPAQIPQQSAPAALPLLTHRPTSFLNPHPPAPAPEAVSTCPQAGPSHASTPVVDMCLSHNPPRPRCPPPRPRCPPSHPFPPLPPRDAPALACPCPPVYAGLLRPRYSSQLSIAPRIPAA